MPKLWGQRVTISAFVDANHARNRVTRHLHTGIIIYVQNALILWYSKRQNTMERLLSEVKWLLCGFVKS
jgi:hypothetical protein